MRNYRPKKYKAYKWDYAMGLIKDYDNLVRQLHDLEGARMGYYSPPEIAVQGGRISDPTYRQAVISHTPTEDERELSKRIEAVEQAWVQFDDTEQQMLRMHIFDGYTYNQLIQYGFPYSAPTIARRKKQLIGSIIRRLRL